MPQWPPFRHPRLANSASAMRVTTRVGPRSMLQEYASRPPELGRFTMDVQAQRGVKRGSRQNSSVRGGPVLVCPPHAKCGHHGNDPLPLFVVRATEVNPPAGEKAIDWTLLTNDAVENFDDAWRSSRAGTNAAGSWRNIISR